MSQAQGPTQGPTLARATLAARIDHTLLAPEADRAAVRRVAEEGLRLGTASVCVNGYWVRSVAEVLAGSPVLTCAVVGFPLGAMAPAAVRREAEQAVADGAREVDMVVPIGLLRSGESDAVAAYVGGVRAATAGVVLKVILETAVLTPDEVVRGCQVSEQAGADFVKTSTGFHAAGGATVEAVRLMRRSVSEAVRVKASGGIRVLTDARAMFDAGADRLGMSATAAVLDELDPL